MSFFQYVTESSSFPKNETYWLNLNHKFATKQVQFERHFVPFTYNQYFPFIKLGLFQDCCLYCFKNSSTIIQYYFIQQCQWIIFPNLDKEIQKAIVILWGNICNFRMIRIIIFDHTLEHHTSFCVSNLSIWHSYQ